MLCSKAMRRLIALACAFALACALPLIPASAQVTGPVSCNANVLNTSITTATTTSLITVPAGSFVCGYLLYGASTASAMTAQFEYGTGSSCTSPTALTPALPVAASTIVPDNSFNFRGFAVPGGKSLCVVTAGTTVALGVQVFYVANNQGATVAQTSSYTGPGDVISGATVWLGLRAYTNAIAAAGTQKLINIARASDSQTCDIIVATSGGMGNTANCSGAGNGQSASSFCNATTCSVTEMYDQSGNGNNVTQTTAANQPALTFNCIGSLPCITYTAASNHELSSPATIAFGNQPLSQSVVALITSNASQQNIVDVATANVQLAAYNTANTSWFIFATLVANFTASVNTLHAAQAVINNASSAANVDGTDTTGLSPGATNPGTNTLIIGSIGASQSPSGQIDEVGEWANTAFTSGNRTSLCQNQQAYYGASHFGATC